MTPLLQKAARVCAVLLVVGCAIAAPAASTPGETFTIHAGAVESFAAMAERSAASPVQKLDESAPSGTLRNQLILRRSRPPQHPPRRSRESRPPPRPARR